MNTEIIKINSNNSNTTIWEPKFGPEFESYVRTKDKDHALRLRKESPRILSSCVAPGNDEQSAGLVLGYVQSGKTSSFTAVAALAHDNEYKCVIIIGGTTKILLEQTAARFKEELRLGSNDVVHRWLEVINPTLNDDSGIAIKNLLNQYINDHRNGTRPVISQIPLIFVMKNTTHLRNLYLLLESIAGPDQKNMSGISALIVDDEAHMHTPNIAGEDELPSRIYSRIKDIRACFLSHSLLQYTATPQANLLAALDDEFSPNFVRLLGTGDNYAGGKELFGLLAPTEAIKTIPDEEVENAQGTDAQPPNSLKCAIASFLIICANNLSEAQKDANDLSVAHNDRRRPERFSMLVHADVSNAIQRNFQKWLISIKTSWLHLLTSENQDRENLINNYFKPQYDDLIKTAYPQLAEFAEVMRCVPQILDQVMIQMVNQQGTNRINFNLSLYHIINGGNLLGVGFTVEGLITTHMMRTPGKRLQSDTIQQRGRFFGYRKSWINRMRIWLQDSSKLAFQGYVRHEEYLRGSLQTVDQGNLSLRQWKRVFRLDPNASFCRRNAIKMELNRFNTDNGWVSQTYLVPDKNNQALNLNLVNNFIQGKQDFLNKIEISKAPPAVCGTSTETEHYSGQTTITQLRNLLASYIVHEDNRADFEIVRLLLEQFETDPQYLNVDVFCMAQGHLPNLRRRQVVTGIENEGRVDLQQGRNDNYCGDRNVRMNNPKDVNARITLQIYKLNHGPSDDDIHERNVVYIAISLPDIIQEEGRQFVTAE